MTAPEPSLRERLAGKQRRRVTIRVQVSDPDEDERAAADARTLWLAAQASDDTPPDRLLELQADLQAAEEALAAHWVQVPFAALTGPDFEALVAAHQRDDDSGEVDDTFLAALAAACVQDESLQDEDWWAGELAHRWAPGEVQALHRELFFGLHYPPIRRGLGKG